LQLPLGWRHRHHQSRSDHGHDPVDREFKPYARPRFGLSAASSPPFCVLILKQPISKRARFGVVANVLTFFGFTITRLGGLIVEIPREE
jgi:hypothetical protein